MQFCPFHKLEANRNIIVDGAAQENSVLVLSHWPASPTPDAWLRDTSTEIVLDFLANEQVPEGVELVSNNHIDEDGLFGICALIDPGFALEHRARFVDAATAGDFGRYRQRDAARVNFTIARFVSTIPETGDYAERAAGLYEALIPMVPRLISDIDEFEAAWVEEDRFLDQCEQWLDQGMVAIVEDDDRDLAIVTIPTDLPVPDPDQIHTGAEGPLHRMAVCNRTRKARVLFQHGQNFWFRYRYETWVKFVSERHPLRVDLAPLCEELSALETDDAIWTYDGSSSITPTMSLSEGRPSSLDAGTIHEHLCRWLDDGEVDWNPFEAADSSHG
jgi:hypothetical protein